MSDIVRDPYGNPLNRDKLITTLRAENERLREWNREIALNAREFVAENERLRAALRECLGWHDYSNDLHKPIEVRAAYMRARAVLEEKR